MGYHLVLNRGAPIVEFSRFIGFVTNDSDDKFILLKRRFDVIFTSFSSSLKVRYFQTVHMTSL